MESNFDIESQMDAILETEPKLLVIVDTQADFMMSKGALYVPNSEELIGTLNTMAFELDPIEFPYVLMTFDTHHEDTYPGSEEAKQFPIHCIEGTPGHANVVNVELFHEDIEIYGIQKPVFDMWADGVDDRDEYIQNVANDGIHRVRIVGVASDYCVKWAIAGFLDRGFAVEVSRSLTRGIMRDIDTTVNEDFEGCNVLVVD